jgi:hypothetical protein
VTLASVLALPSTARATENEWHVGGAFGYGLLVSSLGSIHGGAADFHLRYGLTDAFDLRFDWGVSGYPAQVVVPAPDPAAPEAPVEAVALPDLLMADTAAGVSYVLDVGRWIPHLGFQVGVADVMVISCEQDPAACTHSVHATLGIPGGLEVRAYGPLVLGAHVTYRFLLAGDPGGALFAGGYFALEP